MKALQDKTNVTAPDATWPYGDLNDNPGDNSGTPVNKELLTDVLQLMEKIIDEAGITPNGNPDNDANGWQLYEALVSGGRKYWVYTALITQSGTNAPTVKVLENTLPAGAIVWAYSAPGIYTGTLVGAFTADKTFAGIQQNQVDRALVIGRTSADVVTIVTSDYSGTEQNGSMTDASIEIRVYR